MILTIYSQLSQIPMRKRSWSMPANGPFRVGMTPQISISSPDDPNSLCKSLLVLNTHSLLQLLFVSLILLCSSSYLPISPPLPTSPIFPTPLHLPLSPPLSVLLPLPPSLSLPPSLPLLSSLFRLLSFSFFLLGSVCSSNTNKNPSQN